MRWTVSVSSILAMLSVGTGCRASDAPASVVEAVVYTTLRPPNLDIYSFDRPGGPAQRITNDPAMEYNGTFSPDGRWMVSTSEREGDADLYALDLQRTGAPIRLTHHHAMDDAAAFSPDGRRLAFVSTRDGDADIFIMPFTPTDSRLAEEQATNLTRHADGDFNPAYSPDGRTIAFARRDDLWAPQPAPAIHVYVMKDDGSSARRISAPGGMSGSPAWSADGQTV